MDGDLGIAVWIIIWRLRKGGVWQSGGDQAGQGEIICCGGEVSW